MATDRGAGPLKSGLKRLQQSKHKISKNMESRDTESANVPELVTIIWHHAE